MNLLETLLSKETVILNVASTTKKDLFVELVEKGRALGFFSDGPTMQRLLNERESLGTTGIGKGIAVPHVRTDLVDNLRLVFARARHGIDYDAVDGKPVFFIFLVLAPPEKNELYLKMMARISRLMRTDEVRKAILAAGAEDEILGILGANYKEN